MGDFVELQLAKEAEPQGVGLSFGQVFQEAKEQSSLFLSDKPDESVAGRARLVRRREFRLATRSIDSGKLAPNQTAAGVEQDRPNPAAKRMLGSVGVAMSERRQKCILHSFFGNGLVAQLAGGSTEHGRPMAVDEFVEKFDLPATDSFHDFLVVQHVAWRFQSTCAKNSSLPTMGCCRWMFGGAAAMMITPQAAIVNGIQGLRIAELILPDSAIEYLDDFFFDLLEMLQQSNYFFRTRAMSENPGFRAIEFGTTVPRAVPCRPGSNALIRVPQTRLEPFKVARNCAFLWTKIETSSVNIDVPLPG